MQIPGYLFRRRGVSELSAFGQKSGEAAFRHFGYILPKP